MIAIIYNGYNNTFCITLEGCKKLSHTEGTDPPRDDLKFEAWDDEDSLIMTWLRNFMTPKIRWNYMFYSSRCKADFIAYIGLIERGRIFKFLHDLNSENDLIRVQILRKEKLPSLSETQRSVMLDKGTSNIGSAIVIGKGFTKRSTSDKENLVEHPSTLQLDQDIQAFSKEEMDRLRALLNSTRIRQSIWIFDFGAIDHITLFPSYFTSYLKVSKEQLITIANGDHVPIVGAYNIQFQSSLSLHNALHELTMGRMIEVARTYYLQHTKIVNGQPQKFGQLLKFVFIINVLNIHCLGPTSNFISRAKWFISFIDDCTRVTWIFLIIEFVNLEFSKFIKDNGVVHELTKNCHLLEVARALLFQMPVPNVYWGEVVLIATYLINRLLIHVLNDISPIKHMLSFFPNSPLMLNLPSRVFGCAAFVHSHNQHCEKLDPRAIKCIFIGYPSNKKGFKCYHPLNRQIFISMDVTFHETQSFFVSPPLQGEGHLEVKPIIESLPFCTQDVIKCSSSSSRSHITHSNPKASPIPIKDVTDDMPISLRKGKRSCVKYLISQFVCTDHLSVQYQSFIIAIDAIKMPTSV
ncbi:hypothetical protein CR513_41773, partial [Mucuna pruriens]